MSVTFERGGPPAGPGSTKGSCSVAISKVLNFWEPGNALCNELCTTDFFFFAVDKGRRGKAFAREKW